MDQPWDSTLIEFIPGIRHAQNGVEYHTQILKLAKRTDDTHAFASSVLIFEEVWGLYYLPFVIRKIEGETVIWKVLPGIDMVSAGDIIREIDGVPVAVVRDSLAALSAGSNASAVDWLVNVRIVRGDEGIVSLRLENDTGEVTVALPRDLDNSDYYAQLERTDPVWQVKQISGYRYIIVDMARLLPDDVEDLFNEVFYSYADGILFDVRNYPAGSIYDMIPFLYDGPVSLNVLYPDLFYPGTFSWRDPELGRGDFSQTFEGDIGILFDERSISHAEFTAMLLEQHRNAVKFGSRTAGADGDVSLIYLPGGVRIGMTGLGIFYPDGSPTQRVGILPDIEVRPTIDGIRQGKDEVMQAAVDYLSNYSRVVHGKNRPVEMVILNNYPNPFNHSTTIEYTLPGSGMVSLYVFDIRGRRVREVVIESHSKAGTYRIHFDGNDQTGRTLSSGLYFLVLTFDKSTTVRKLSFLR